MLNKEKYADEIFDFAIYGKMFGINNGKPKSCASMKLCKGCEYKNILGCREKLKEWLNSEYVDTTMDWNNVPIDTPIWVRDIENAKWSNRYFAGIKDGKVYGWKNGKTSWTVGSENECTYWKYAMMAEDVDYPQVNSQWHNLKDLKPEDRQEVIVWDGRGVYEDRWSDDADYFEYADAEEIWWMAMPEPPTKGVSHE